MINGAAFCIGQGALLLLFLLLFGSGALPPQKEGESPLLPADHGGCLAPPPRVSPRIPASDAALGSAENDLPHRRQVSDARARRAQEFPPCARKSPSTPVSLMHTQIPFPGIG